MSLRRRVEDVWYGVEGGPLATLLAPAAALYATGHAVRKALYRGGVVTPAGPEVPCISVGNIVVGGTGKTPMTAWIAGRLLGRGLRPAIVSRGYGGKTRQAARVPVGGGGGGSRVFGDEPVMLARSLPEVPVVVARNRAEAAALAVREHGADIIVADDAFQHWRLRRDLDIVLVDGRRWFGNRRLLPWGPLREPPGALARAGAVVLTRPRGEEVGEKCAELRRLAPGAVVAAADIVPGRWRRRGSHEDADPPEGPVFAFCGIADPRPFIEAAGRMRPLAGQVCFGDHHPYSRRDMKELEASVAGSGAAAAVTTAKDDVRLERWEAGVPLYILDVELRFREGEEHVAGLIGKVAGRGR